MAFELAPGYVIHSRAWGETGALVDVFLRDHGRLTLSARGVNKPNAKLKPLLTPFSPLLISALGNGQMLLLKTIEHDGVAVSLHGNALIAAMYLNELLSHLLRGGECAPRLYLRYSQTLERLGSKITNVAPLLREFERVLLETLGLAPDWQHDQRGEHIDADASYRLVAGAGFSPCDPLAAEAITGGAVLHIANDRIENAAANAQRSINRLFRLLLDDALGGRALRSRELWLLS